MQHLARLLAGTVALVLTATFAQAAVTISSGATANMSCANGTCAPTAKSAVLNVGDLENLLASGNVTVTTAGTGVQAKDIAVKAPINWSDGSVLTLDAYRSVAIDQAISIAGVAGLTMDTNDGGSNGAFSMGRKGSVTFANLSSTLTIDGAAYTLVGDIKTLSSDIASNPSGAFALANSFDASKDGTYTSCPIAVEFTGLFEGLGNQISNLSIAGATVIDNNPHEGLFAWIGVQGTLRDVRLVNANIGEPDRLTLGGALAGESSGIIAGSFATGIVSAAKLSSSGGLVGFIDSSGTVSNSWAAVAVTGKNPEEVGGLVGLNSGVISASHASGAIIGGAAGGGLVGGNVGEILSSFATGSVSARTVGGLVGPNQGMIETSFATGAVRIKGPLGYAALGGGLVGFNEAPIDNSYATGSVSGPDNADVGGLVGQNYSTINSSYSTGTVSAGLGSLVGGLVGDDEAPSGSLDATYWDTDTSGITNLGQGAGNIANDPGITGLTTAQFQSGLPAGFDPSVWAEKSYINGGLPYLLDTPPPK
jgi:hypothetical protein